VTAGAAAQCYASPGMTVAGLAHLIRTEYVVVRARRTIADRLGWPPSALEEASFAATARDIAAELPEFLRWAVANDDVPQRLDQHWGELILAWGGESGRADAGDASARADLDAFYRHQIIVPSAALWRQLGAALGDLYSQPTAASLSSTRRWPTKCAVSIGMASARFGTRSSTARCATGPRRAGSGTTERHSRTF
jgi:hypothetical protein